MVRHVIVFNFDGTPEQARAMAEEAGRVLGAIPVVTEVRFGEAVAEGARYRYFFDIGLADEAAIDVYRDHPAHQRFAEERFRPRTPDRLTIDYRLT
jgi:fructose-bisphosphate aldolase class II